MAERRLLRFLLECADSAVYLWVRSMRSVKDFTPFTLFNLALWFKLYFSFRESYDLILI